MDVKIYCIAALAACHSPQASTVRQGVTRIGCVDPVAYGAVPSDGVDDRVAIQTAIDVGGDVCLGPGTWEVSRAPIGSYDRFAALSWHSAHVHVHGAGTLLTTIRLSGDQALGSTHVFSLDPGVDDAYIGNMAIDTTDAFNTDEQTHAIAIGSGVCSGGGCSLPVANVTIDHVRFVHPVRDGERKGDCIRVLGNTVATQAHNIKLLDLDFLSCARSGIAMQRNANDVTISRSYFDGDRIGGTPIDGEATGGEFQHGLIISDNILERTLIGGDTYGLSLTSQTHFTITGNVFRGRGMNVYRANDGVISGNVIDDASQVIGGGSIEMANTSTNVAIVGNRIHRTGATGPTIRIGPHSGAFPGPLVVSNNTITNETDSAVIMIGGANDVVISGNQLQGAGTANTMGIYVYANTRTVENVSITGNVIRSGAFAAVRLGATSTLGFIGGVSVAGNTSRASGPGIRCDNSASNTPGSIVRGLNNWSTSETCP